MLTTDLNPSGVLEIVINRPPVNAFSLGLISELSALLEGAGQRPEVRSLLLRSEGRGFCGGGDVKEVEALPGFEGILGHAEGSLRLSLALMQCAVPVVAAVHGYCVGIGVLAAASADVIVSSRDTRFVLAEIDNGATAGAVQALRLMPEKLVRAAMMTADPVLAQDLHRCGGIYDLAETHEAVAGNAMAIAARIASKSPDAARRLKASINNTTRISEVAALYRAEMSYTYELNILGAAHSGRKAFLSGERSSYAD